MKMIRSLAFVLALLISITALVGCNYDKYSHETFYGVVRHSEDFGGLLICIPDIGDVCIPAYEKCISSFNGSDPNEEDDYEIGDGDLLKIHFRYERHWDSHGVPIMETYPAQFGMKAHSIEVMRQGVEFEKVDTGYTFSFTEADNKYSIGETLYVIYHHGYNGVDSRRKIAEGKVTAIQDGKVTLDLTLYTEAGEFLPKYLSSSVLTSAEWEDLEAD
jgi:hypothetical protein